MDRAAWQAIVPGVAKSQTRLKQLTQQEGVTTLELTVLLVHLAIAPPPRLSVKGLAPSVASGEQSAFGQMSALTPTSPVAGI